MAERLFGEILCILHESWTLPEQLFLAAVGKRKCRHLITYSASVVVKEMLSHGLKE